MANRPVFKIQPEVITLIFSYLIFNLESFSTFVKLLLIWERNQSTNDIKFVLESLNWDKLYELHQHEIQVTRDMFYGFITYCVRHNVSQAMFFNSTHNLLKRVNVTHNLQVLSIQSSTHFPSHFAYVFFKAIFRPTQIDVTAAEMFKFLNNSVLKLRVQEMIKLLADMYVNLTDFDYLLPPIRLCPNARGSRLLHHHNQMISEEAMWNSTCSEGVPANFLEEGELWPRGLKLADMWNSKCPYCTLQLLLFKILLSALNY